MKRASVLALALLFGVSPLWAASTGSGLVSKEGEQKTAEKISASETKTVSAGKFYMPELSKEDQKLKGELMTVRGFVSAIGPMGIAVSYEKDMKAGTDKEMWFDFHSQMQVKGAKSLSNFGEGDIVAVTYLNHVKTEKQETGETVVGGRKIMKEIKFVKKAPKVMEDEPEPEGSAT